MWKRTLLILGLAIIAAAVIFACGPSAGGPAAAKAKKGKVVATVGSSTITTGDIEEILNRMPPFQRKRFADDKGKKELLDNLVNEELFYQEALRRGLDRDPDFVARMDQFRRGILANMVKKTLYEQEIPVTDAEVKKYYDDNKDKFMTPETVKVRLILIKAAQDAPNEEVTKAKAKADEVLKKLRAGGNWDKLCEQYSDDRGTNKRGGLLTRVRKGVRGQEFDDVAFTLPINKISDVFRSRQGFNIIKVEEKTAAELRDFDSVKSTIERQLKQQKLKTKMDEAVETMRKKAAIKINQDVLNAIQVDTSGGEGGMPGMPMMPGQPAGGPMRPGMMPGGAMPMRPPTGGAAPGAGPSAVPGAAHPPAAPAPSSSGGDE
jgi:peptidyl-prolyl cis-trans isomerase C